MKEGRGDQPWEQQLRKTGAEATAIENYPGRGATASALVGKGKNSLLVEEGRMGEGEKDGRSD
jgi:hypothetical protein